MSAYDDFKKECAAQIEANGSNPDLAQASSKWMAATARNRYSYHFEWMGRPIVQYPQDMVAMHELIWRVQPDLIIETGIAHGGSLIFSASMLELNAIAGGAADARVLGIDIDIRAHNRAAIEAHPMARRIDMIQGSSIADQVICQVHALAVGKKRVLVFLDSNHTHEHVLQELNAYASLVPLGSYCVVFDTVIEDLPPDFLPGRPWGRGNSPKSAVAEWIKAHPEFEIDKSIDNKLLVSVAPDGYLKRVC